MVENSRQCLTHLSIYHNPCTPTCPLIFLTHRNTEKCMYVMCYFETQKPQNKDNARKQHLACSTTHTPLMPYSLVLIAPVLLWRPSSPLLSASSQPPSCRVLVSHPVASRPAPPHVAAHVSWLSARCGANICCSLGGTQCTGRQGQVVCIFILE